ncbi:helix-turn-helix domain-containing protein [Leucothrix arctica]|uniref:Helix-turn-helix domain-containing protein n=1 Tax=Leucothrix arctica TaxID=1481894 RepID=A0A317C5D9_9GAMM|nr:helix-turn-helix domain-containing protein [Leucothrix arctica]PWQ93875.1 hypothetical protein DKT75_19945 [Leucothrix arctica]
MRNLFAPVMTVAQFAECVGVSEGVVTGWVKREYIPTVKIGRHRLVNIILLSATLNDDADILDLPNIIEREEVATKATEYQQKSNVEHQHWEEIKESFDMRPRNERRALLKKHGSKDAACQWLVNQLNSAQ